MAQAKKPRQKNEPSGSASEEALDQASQRTQEFGDQIAGQARDMGEQASEQMRQFGEQASEQMRQFGEQARALNEQIVETAAKVGQDALQRYVAWLQAIAEQQRTLASSPQVSQMDWFASMLNAQADFTQQFAKMVGGMAPFGRQPES
jgi:DNA-binding ferritin-like protein